MGELKKIIILFDCPCEENDKKWLYDELQKIYGTSGTDVIPLYTKNALAVLKNSGKRVSYLIQGLKLSAEAIQKSRGGGSLVCWGVTTGFITNFLSRILGNSREILAMNWLTPINPPFLAIWLRRMMVNNRRCRIIVNSVESKDKWLKVLRVKDRGNIYFIPDTYDSQIEFQRPYRRENVYCFTGGENNRDWKFLMKIAEQMPEMEFICAAYEADFRQQVNHVPENVRVYYSLPVQEYYALMKGASVILLPLRDNRVSGLINITHAAQYGQVCISTRTKATELYYREDLRRFLPERDLEKWVESLSYLIQCSNDEYVSVASGFQDYIRRQFNPEEIARELSEVIGG